MSIQSEAFNEEVHSKKSGKLKNDGSLGLMAAEQIRHLIANAVKAQLGEGVWKIHLYIKPYTKRVDTRCMSLDYQPLKFQQFYRKGNPK